MIAFRAFTNELFQKIFDTTFMKILKTIKKKFFLSYKKFLKQIIIIKEK